MSDPLTELTTPTVKRAPTVDIDGLVTKHADRTGLDPELIRHVIGQESGGNPNAKSWAGAHGVMQLMPGTAERYGVKNTQDPDENMRGGTDYLRDLMTEFKDPQKAVAAYNAGEGAVRKMSYQRVRTLSNLPKGDPRRGGYQGSTGEYVDKILKNYEGSGFQADPLTSLTGDQPAEVDPLTQLTSGVAPSGEIGATPSAPVIQKDPDEPPVMPPVTRVNPAQQTPVVATSNKQVWSKSAWLKANPDKASQVEKAAAAAASIYQVVD